MSKILEVVAMIAIVLFALVTISLVEEPLITSLKTINVNPGPIITVFLLSKAALLLLLIALIVMLLAGILQTRPPGSVI